mgnify:CR=1 FL=1
MGTHNMYFQLGSETGVIGLLFVLAFLFLALRDLHRAERIFEQQEDREGRILSASVWVSLVTFLLCAIFLHALQQKIWWMVAAAATVIPLLARGASKEDAASREQVEN